jgi:3',5'-cyclic-AMP phosphodiesterase
MKIIEFGATPVREFRYLNAGRRSGGYFEDRLPVHVAKVDRLPNDVCALLATADLQGRERFEDGDGGPIRLLGEVLPRRLAAEVLPELELRDTDRVGVLLAGDFYTVPALDRRGGTGDVTGVWRAFADCFGWVVGVTGNHDTFGNPPQQRPRFPQHMQLLDGDVADLHGLRFAGIGGIIGNPDRWNRRSEEDYLAVLGLLLERNPDVLLMHDGPDGPQPGQRGQPRVREAMLGAGGGLVIRGHAHWADPFTEFDAAWQVLNVDARVVVLMK